MGDNNRVQKTLENLSELIKTVDLGPNLFEEAVEYFEILEDKNSTDEDKHRACILVEDLMSKTRDFPRVNTNLKHGRR